MTRRQLIKKAKRGEWDVRYLGGHEAPMKDLWPYITKAYARGLVVTSTTDGVHTPTSFHYSARAVDFGVVGPLVGTPLAMLRLVRFQRYLHKNYGPAFAELFGPNNSANRKWGKPLRLDEGSALESLHDNHVHIAI